MDSRRIYNTEPASIEYAFYDSTYSVVPFGLTNTGTICWWNSLLQTLLSCTCFNKKMLELEKELDGSKLAREYINIIKCLTPFGTNIIKPHVMGFISIHLLNVFRRELQVKKITLDLQSQEGAANGLIVFLDIIGHEAISALFNNRYRRIIRCSACEDVVSTVDETMPVINMTYSKPLTDTEFRNYILKNISFVDKYKCDKCRVDMKQPIPRLESLVMIREIITVIFKYKSTVNQKFPLELKFRAVDDPEYPGMNIYLRYELTSIICHSGYYNMSLHQSGGHYWAFCKRGKKFYRFNDATVEQREYKFDGDAHTAHIVMYNLVEQVRRPVDDDDIASLTNALGFVSLA